MKRNGFKDIFARKSGGDSPAADRHVPEPEEAPGEPPHAGQSPQESSSSGMNTPLYGMISKLFISTRRLMFVVIMGVLVYELCENLSAVRTAVSSFLGIISPLFIGIAIAFIVNMPMRFLEKRVFGRIKRSSLKRGISLALALIFVLAIVAAIVFLIIPNVVSSIQTIAAGFDGYVVELTDWGLGVWDRMALSDDIVARLNDAVSSFLDRIDAILGDLVSYILKFTVNVVTVVVNLFLSIILAVYALYRRDTLIRQLKKLVLAVFGERRAKRISYVGSQANATLNSYFYGMLLECFILGVMMFIAMKLLGFPFALLISVIVGVTQMAPIIGPWVSAFVGALIILVVDPPKALWFLLTVFVVQQLEENLVYPRVVGKSVGLSGIWVMMSIVIGGGLFGITGIVLCVPVTAVLYTLLSEWVNARIARQKAGEAGEAGEAGWTGKAGDAGETMETGQAGNDGNGNAHVPAADASSDEGKQ